MIASDPSDIACWQRLDARTTTSGRLAAGDPARLAAIGVRHVINLAPADSSGALAHENALLAAHAIAYTHIPVPFDAPRLAHYEAFRAALDAGPHPVHVHCIMNWRVSAFFYRYHRERGEDAVAARARLERQWSPETHPHKDAPAWARFIAGEA